MLFKLTLYCSLTIFVVGMVWRLLSWFRAPAGFMTGERRPGRQANTLAALVPLSRFRRVVSFLGVFFLDVLLQTRLLREDFGRWFAHLCILYGFVFLLLMHALGSLVTATLFPQYTPTLNPFFFLRDAFGAVVLLGLAVAVSRRLRSRDGLIRTNASDRLALVAVALITLSGVALAGVKMLSPSLFAEMVQEYAPMIEPEDLSSLQRFWDREFGVSFADTVDSTDADSVDRGRLVHEENCSGCHSPARSAFLSYGTSTVLKPISAVLERYRVRVVLWHVHFLTCFVGLALIPFGKMLHAFSSPARLLANLISDSESGHRSSHLALDACTHCGICSLHCSVRLVSRSIPNRLVLPSEKLWALRALSRGKAPKPTALETFSEGSFVCTLCHRCTEVCPAGIDLQDLWLASRGDLSSRGYPEPHVWIGEAGAATWAERVRQADPGRAEAQTASSLTALADRTDRFSACVQCQTCTNVCPVVGCGGGTWEGPDLTPQQIMNLLRLGLKEMALGSAMVWNCLTCYLCQEHCPEGIPIADILYELRSVAYQKLLPCRMLTAGSAKDKTTR